MDELRFDGVRKRFEDTLVLQGLDLSVPAGTLVTLVGPSGSGKSTLLRIAAGLEAADAGRVLIGDDDATALPPAARNVSMVFQAFALFPHMTVGDNVIFGLRARGVPREERERRGREAARLAGCDHLLDRRPAELSGGERQRVALARAVSREPRVFLLDEPLSNLDAPVRAGMRTDLRRLQQTVARAMLYVTHDQVEALTLGDLVAVLHGGRIQQVGTPDEVFRRPANRTVATFLGAPGMNVFPATVEGGRLRAGSLDLGPSPLERTAGVEAGVRPSDVRVGDPSGGTGAIVDLVEVAGEDCYVHLSVGDISLVATMPAASRPGSGDTVGVQVEPEAVYVFDPSTGETLHSPR